jgi:enamine deaminase RidA (YjgF/YER057c/UK114 family)
MKIQRNPETVHAPVGAYSHQIEVSGAERWLVLSGQIGSTLDGSTPADVLEQYKLALENISRNLEAAGMGVQDVVKLTFYLAGEMDTGKRREALAAWLQGHQPCMTLLYVAGLASPALKVEIDAWATRAE